MTKVEILEAFSKLITPISPDELRQSLNVQLDRRSFYSYLHRLNRQGLLARFSEGRGQLRYYLTTRGNARLNYLKRSITLNG
jgi:DNA-binding PadR family transcriptional regulator